MQQQWQDKVLKELKLQDWSQTQWAQEQFGFSLDRLYFESPGLLSRLPEHRPELELGFNSSGFNPLEGTLREQVEQGWALLQKGEKQLHLLVDENIFFSSVKVLTLKVLAHELKITPVISVKTDESKFSQTEPWSNLNRQVLALFTSLTCHVDKHILVDNFSEDKEQAREVSLRAVDILKEESFLGREFLPQKGSYAFESVVSKLVQEVRGE
jgi:hypothetical protein